MDHGKHIWLVAVLIPVFFLQGCVNRAVPAEDGILPDSVMVSMLADFFITEGVMIQLEYLNRKEPASAVPLYDKIFEKYNTTRDDFIRSMEHYAENPEHLDRIYDLAVQRLSREQEEVGEQVEAAEKK